MPLKIGQAQGLGVQFRMFAMRFLDTYQQLALWSLENGVLRWPLKPKFHAARFPS